MKTRLSLSAGLLFFIAAPALADADWVWVSESKHQKDETYVDRSSIRVTGTIRRYWQRRDYMNSVSGWKKTMALYENNCATGQKRLLQVTGYKADGVSETETGNLSLWEYITPDTVEQNVHDYVCKQ